MHHWGDKDVDWQGIWDAAEYIGEGLRKWRVDVHQYKEKFGEVRVYCTLGLTCLHQLTHPGYVFSRWPSWAWKLQYTGPARLLTRILDKAIYPFHVWLYKRYYRKARERWPHLAQEIYRAADYPELLGAKTHGTCIRTTWWPEWDDEPED